ncbi:hypothetical protein PCLA_05r0109 [Pseudomonas citronellolis]|nr:hypothetical protein PCLA_05r0109 [Pseudomonas citronellolis]
MMNRRRLVGKLANELPEGFVTRPWFASKLAPTRGARSS